MPASSPKTRAIALRLIPSNALLRSSIAVSKRSHSSSGPLRPESGSSSAGGRRPLDGGNGSHGETVIGGVSVCGFLLLARVGEVFESGRVSGVGGSEAMLFERLAVLGVGGAQPRDRLLSAHCLAF